MLEWLCCLDKSGNRGNDSRVVGDENETPGLSS